MALASFVPALLIIDYPQIDPVLVEIGPFPIRWYALGYFFGIIFGFMLIRRVAVRTSAPVTRRHLDDFLLWCTLGIIIGGRTGYVLFYNFPAYVDDPLAAFRLWDGGMSFHGGFLGVVLATLLFTRHHRIPLMRFSDLLACGAPIGIFLVRMANFINAELWGRQTDAPWAMIFPTDPLQVPRHPSQLYEAFLEGIVLLVVLNLLSRRRWVIARAGLLTAVFMIGYGMARWMVEYVREPDAQLGVLWGLVTMGQLLSLPMILVGAAFAWAALTGRTGAKPLPKPQPRRA